MSEVHFGGPDRPARCLRDLLKQRIEAVPARGSIDWATYYFRDRDLARALIAASDRGVRVTLHVEGRPRRAGANADVLAMLTAHGLRGGLHIHAPSAEWLAPLHPHLHAKVYAFSHPKPMALVGSFNPSGDEPEDADVIAEIGDQDRGHNMLVDYRDPLLVDALTAYVRRLGGGADRFRPGRTVHAGATSLYFYPRFDTAIIDRALARIGPGARIRGAISHMKKGFLADGLAGAARRGASVRLIVHDTERRVPQATVAMLAAADIAVTRYVRKDKLPLHAKLLLVEDPGGERTAWFGSFNYNPRSRYLNHELLVRSRDPALFDALSARFDAIAAEIPQ